MKRLMMLSGACVLLGSVYAVWLERRRRLLADEQNMKMQTWESEGGSSTEMVERNPSDAANVGAANV